MSAEVIAAQLSPYQVQVEKGRTYEFCQCGRSAAQPFCDGSHAADGVGPLSFTAERTETLLLCGCKETGDPPFCDGTHNIL